MILKVYVIKLGNIVSVRWRSRVSKDLIAKQSPINHTEKPSSATATTMPSWRARVGIDCPGRFAKQICDVWVSWCRIWVVCLAWQCNCSKHSRLIEHRTLYANDWFIARIVAHVSRRLLVPNHPGQAGRWVGWSIEYKFCHNWTTKIVFVTLARSCTCCCMILCKCVGQRSMA